MKAIGLRNEIAPQRLDTWRETCLTDQMSKPAAPDPAGPVAALQKAAKGVSGEPLDDALDKLGHKPDREKPTIKGKTPDRSSPATRLQTSAKRAEENTNLSDEEIKTALSEIGLADAVPAKPQTKRIRVADAEQSAEFERVARNLACDVDDDERFKGVSLKLATPKG